MVRLGRLNDDNDNNNNNDDDESRCANSIKFSTAHHKS